MEIADTVSCDFYATNSWDGREESQFRIYKNDAQVGLELQTRRLDGTGDTEAVTQLKLSRMDLKTFRGIHDSPGEWLGGGGVKETEFETGPVEGRCE